MTEMMYEWKTTQSWVQALGDVMTGSSDASPWGHEFDYYLEWMVKECPSERNYNFINLGKNENLPSNW